MSVCHSPFCVQFSPPYLVGFVRSPPQYWVQIQLSVSPQPGPGIVLDPVSYWHLSTYL